MISSKLRRSGLSGRQPEQSEIRVVGDRREDVVEVVRDAAGESADGLHLLRLEKLHSRDARAPARCDDGAARRRGALRPAPGRTARARPAAQPESTSACSTPRTRPRADSGRTRCDPGAVGVARRGAAFGGCVEARAAVPGEQGAPAEAGGGGAVDARGRRSGGGRRRWPPDAARRRRRRASRAEKNRCGAGQRIDASTTRARCSMTSSLPPSTVVSISS